ncbi:MAG: hypothetical protein QOE70_465 [Chthoniobacter sp.]|jgi:hypothetical protein|nr:hypothetical protein [Chthoniobacter sp.]
MIGKLLADRYQVLEEGPRAHVGRLYRARDLAFGELVAVRQISPGPAIRSSIRELETEMRRVQRHAHPCLVRHDTLRAEEGLLIREWVHGFSLLELLKRRHELPAADALYLLASLPATFEFIAAHGLRLPRQLLGKLLVQFDANVEPEEIVGRPIRQWPPFALKLNPLSMRVSLPVSDSETTMTTLSDLRTSLPEPRVNAPARLAELLYETLGGHVRTGRDRRYSPLPALREEANGMLRRALVESSGQDCRHWWADLERAEPSDFRPAAPLEQPAPPKSRTLRIPPARGAPGTPARVLKLVPANSATPAIHLIAQPKFKLGRSLSHADFVARFLPETSASDDLTNQISRTHALAECNGGRLFLRDGNGDAPSVNGTNLDDEPLASHPPTPLRNRVLLALGGVYSLEVIPLVAESPTALVIPESVHWPGPPPPAPPLGGAVFFIPARGQPPLRHAVWLFSEAGFGLDGSHRVIWDTRGVGRSPASLHHHLGCFWLSNHALPHDVLEVAGTPLAREQIAPLVAGQGLRIGALHFTVQTA